MNLKHFFKFGFWRGQEQRRGRPERVQTPRKGGQARPAPKEAGVLVHGRGAGLGLSLNWERRVEQVGSAEYAEQGAQICGS